MRFYRVLLWFAAVPLYSQGWTPMEHTLTGSSTIFYSSSGHSWADIDGDGDYDLIVSGLPRLFLNRALEDGTFVNSPQLLPGGFIGNGISATFGDFDNDGDPDVHLGRSQVDNLLENRWPEPFVDVAVLYGLSDPAYPQSINWVDYNLDGLLDIYITHEFPGPGGAHQFYESAYPDPFVPRFPAEGQPDTFGLADRNSHAYGLSWADFDRDGDMDAITSACGTASEIPGENPHNKIYRNKHPLPGFEDLSLATGFVDAAEVSAGSASYWALLFDYDGDAWPDISIGSLLGDHRLWRNTGQTPGDFSLALVPSSTHQIQGFGAFLDGACAGDVDNDGDLDLYATTDGLFINNGDGSYTLRSDLVPAGGQDSSFVDYDLDGHLDLFNFGDLYRNPGGYDNHWIAIELVGDSTAGSTRSAHGAKIRLLANGVNQYREHRSMVGTYSQHMLPTHFGVGSATIIDELEITWPSGASTLFTDVEVDTYKTYHEDLCFLDAGIVGAAAVNGCLGETIILQLQTVGAGPFTYQWRKDGLPIPGEEGEELSFPMNGIEETGSYDCVVNNGCNTATTQETQLNLAEELEIVAQPQQMLVVSGAMGSLSVTLSEAPESYQWRKDGAALQGETSQTLSFDSLTSDHIGVYDCSLAANCFNPLITQAVAVCVLDPSYPTAIQAWPGTGSVQGLVAYVNNACP